MADRVRQTTAAEVAALLTRASRVIVVPGYGLGVAQAQTALGQLVDLLLSGGVEVVYAIHPVAGRFPGHLNFLLADVPPSRLRVAAEVETELARTDVVLAVGANDIINPAAATDPSSPLFGVPALDLRAGAQAVIMKRSLAPGFAGVRNPIFHAPNVNLLLGDAGETLNEIVAVVAATRPTRAHTAP